MKLSCLPVSIYPMLNSGEMSIEKWSEEAKRIGFDAFDLGEGSIENNTLAELEEIRRACVIPFNMLSAYSDFTHPDTGERKKSVEEVKVKIRKTAALGGKYIRIPGGAAHSEAVCNIDTAIDNMCECFTECIPVAEECGVRIVFENDSQPPSWDVPNFCFDIERFVRTWNKLKDLPIGFNYDTGNAFFLDKWQVILYTVIDRIETLHITDYDYRDGELNMTVFGEGTVPIREMLTIIKDNGFKGMVSMEDTTFKGLEGTAKSYDYVRKLTDDIFGK